MQPLTKTLEIRTSPHIVSGYSVDTMMFNTVVALLPVLGFAVYAFGVAALATLSVAVGACLATEWLAGRSFGSRSTIEDWSAVVTGLLFGLTLPSGLPIWMVAVGGAVSLGVGKILFGGLGANPFNPALVGRAFLQAAFPAAMTTWLSPFGPDRFISLPASTLALPLSQPTYDGVSGATALARWKFAGVSTPLDDLSLGFVGGSIGETPSVLILFGGVYLVARNLMNWRTPVSILGVVAVLSGVLHLVDPTQYASTGFMLSSGGLMLGAVFMATDPVSSPVTGTGRLIYGSLIGLLVVVIRVWGGMPEGVMYAILLGNAATPQIERICQPAVYGAGPNRRVL